MSHQQIKQTFCPRIQLSNSLALHSGVHERNTEYTTVKAVIGQFCARQTLELHS